MIDSILILFGSSSCAFLAVKGLTGLRRYRTEARMGRALRVAFNQ